MTISWKDFEKVDLRVGKIIKAEPFPEARKPAFVLHIDIGEERSIKSTAQLTAHYTIESLLNKHVIIVRNLEPKQVGPHISECLILGALDENNEPILLQPERHVAQGSKIA